MAFDAHERAFSFFKGACTRGIYDNMKTAVETIFVGKDRPAPGCPQQRSHPDTREAERPVYGLHSERSASSHPPARIIQNYNSTGVFTQPQWKAVIRSLMSFSFRVVSDKSMIVSGVGSVSGSAGAKRFRIVNQKTRESTPKRARGQLVLAATKHDRPSRLTPAQNLELEPVGFWRGQTFQRVLIGCRAGVSFSLIGRPQGG
jgi:hypothetical protein